MRHGLPCHVVVALLYDGELHSALVIDEVVRQAVDGEAFHTRSLSLSHQGSCRGAVRPRGLRPGLFQAVAVDFLLVDPSLDDGGFVFHHDDLVWAFCHRREFVPHSWFVVGLLHAQNYPVTILGDLDMIPSAQVEVALRPG